MIELKKIYCVDCYNFKSKGNIAHCIKNLIIEPETNTSRYFFIGQLNKGLKELEKDTCSEYIDMKD